MVLLLNRVFKNNKIEKRLSALFSLKSYFIANSAAILVIFDNILLNITKSRRGVLFQKCHHNGTRMSVDATISVSKI